VGEVRYTYRILARKPEENGPLAVREIGSYRNRRWRAD